MPCGAQEDDQQKDDEDRRVLQLVGQHQGRHLLHDADHEPAPERAEDAAEPAEHDPGIHDDDEIEPDIGLERLRARRQPAGDRGDADPEAPGEAVRAVDVDAHVDRRLAVVGGGAQPLAEPRMAEEQVHRDGQQRPRRRS